MTNEENEAAGRQLRGLLDVPGDALIAVLGSGGARVAAGLVGPDEADPYLLDGFGAVARLARTDRAVVVLADDGTAPAEEVAAAAWSLMGTDPERLVVAAPMASRYLEVLLPPRCEVLTLRRYVPVRPESGRSTAGDAPRERRRPKPERAGRPWSAEEEVQLAGLIRDHTSLEQIAATLGRTRGAISTRIAQLAVRSGSMTLEPTPSGSADS